MQQKPEKNREASITQQMTKWPFNPDTPNRYSAKKSKMDESRPPLVNGVVENVSVCNSVADDSVDANKPRSENTVHSQSVPAKSVIRKRGKFLHWIWFDGDDSSVKYYTGMPNFKTLATVFEDVHDEAEKLLLWNATKTKSRKRLRR